jgi:polyhydroxybutyrate depolymerase
MGEENMDDDVQIRATQVVGPTPFAGCRRIQAFILALFVGLILNACASSLPLRVEQGGGTYEAKVDTLFQGSQRTYRVHLPPSYDSRRPLPLVIVLHGALGNARSIERSSRFSDLADEKNFIALYPNGIGFFGGLGLWNAGHCCSKAAEENVDDVGFLTTVIEDACARLAVDRRRIYMAGFSNGGMMVYRFAAERGDLLAAAAPLAASAGGRPDRQSPEWSIPYPVAPLPILAMQGLADTRVPLKGGLSPSRGGQREYWSVQRSLDVWIRRNGCARKPIVKEMYQGKVQVTIWPETARHDPVELYTLKGWGHEWPGLFNTDELDPRDPLYDFDATRIIWDFFKDHSR